MLVWLSEGSLSAPLVFGGLHLIESVSWEAWVAILGAIAALVAAGATGYLALITKRDIRPTLSRLATAEFVVDELDELIQQGACGPDEKRSEENPLADPTLLREVEVGEHSPVFDRLVFRFVGGIPGYEIVPMNKDELSASEVMGVWGLRVLLSPCRLAYREQTNQGETAMKRTSGYPNSPTIVDYRLLDSDGTVCEWVIGSKVETRFLVKWIDDDNGERLFIDLYRRPKDG